ncbi:MAG TPA: CHAP domain-containing protein [Gaiellaceae bacterium]|nr:CHAP domain-containing protein [Gaiellaceae bacterium]
MVGSHLLGRWSGRQRARSTRRTAAGAAAAAVAFLSLYALVPHGRAAVATPAATRPQPIIYGYPYASRCPGAGLAHVVDRWGMYACNCTSYVAWALSANGQRIDWFVPGAMDAWNWPNVARAAGLVVDRIPRRGAVAVWPHVAPPYGHVAYVTNVDPDGRVDVAEYNFPLLGSRTFMFDTRTEVTTAGAVFVHVPRALNRRRRDEPLR